MRVICSTKTALERQTREAVRIRRRGGEGAILNSKIFYPDSDAAPLLEDNQGISNTLHGVVVVDIGERESDQELSESLKQD